MQESRNRIKSNAVNYFIHSEPGYQHVNEDVVEVRRLTGSAAMLVCALADGQGGTSGGAEAARTAVQYSHKLASTFLPEALLDDQTWPEIVRNADEAVATAPGAGYTTLVCIAVTATEVVGASCGDSAAFLLNEGCSRILTRRQIKKPPVGSAAAQAVSFSAALGNAWKLLVMSDGVWKYVGWERIEEMSRQYDGEALIEALRHAAASNWGGKIPDDFTLALFENIPA